MIPAGPTDIITLIECVDFAQFEGKTTYDSFEVELVDRLMDSVVKTKLPLDTELLIAAFLDKVDNLTDDRYQQKVARKLKQGGVSSLFFAELDMNNTLNKRLIAMCVKKKVFADDSLQSVVYPLMMYGKYLQGFKAWSSKIEVEDFDDGFRPDVGAVRYHTSF